jgi:hypothetical protein
MLDADKAAHQSLDSVGNLALLNVSVRMRNAKMKHAV